MSIPVCIPTVNCYDLLERCVNSLLDGSVKPSQILVVDNGGSLAEYLKDKDYPITLFTPDSNLGVAASWNWFIRQTKNIRVITNDDIVFGKFTLESMIEAYDEGAEFISANAQLCNFSCFAVTDVLLKKIGLFDENISPRYAYYEDNDFSYRMRLAGVSITDVNSPIIHDGSSTLKKYTPAEQAEHWRKFNLAKYNYYMKWGGEPDREARTVPYNNELQL